MNMPDFLFFDGTNWQDWLRVVAAAQFQFLEDPDNFETEEKKCAYLAQRCKGAALDYIANQYSVAPKTTFSNLQKFIVLVSDHFGIDDDVIKVERREGLDKLKWKVPVAEFFAEFDRLTSLLHITSNQEKIQLLNGKLPANYRKMLAEQALSFNDYSTMRGRLFKMTVMLGDSFSDTSAHKPKPAKEKRDKCGKCGKKGHKAADCRSKN
jgi:hypothetical protein